MLWINFSGLLMATLRKNMIAYTPRNKGVGTRVYWDILLHSGKGELQNMRYMHIHTISSTLFIYSTGIYIYIYTHTHIHAYIYIIYT